MCDPDGNVRRYVESGQIRPLLVLSPKRVPEMGNAPTALEFGYKVSLAEWRSIVVKAGTDPSKIRFLSDALARLYKTPEYQQFLKSNWSDPESYVSSKDMPAFIQAKQQEMQALLGATH